MEKRHAFHKFAIFLNFMLTVLMIQLRLDIDTRQLTRILISIVSKIVIFLLVLYLFLINLLFQSLLNIYLILSLYWLFGHIHFYRGRLETLNTKLMNGIQYLSNVFWHIFLCQNSVRI